MIVVESSIELIISYLNLATKLLATSRNQQEDQSSMGGIQHNIWIVTWTLKKEIVVKLQETRRFMKRSTLGTTNWFCRQKT